MKLLLVTIRKRAGSDDVSRRETILDGTEFHIGRGVSMEINLPDIDIDYHHATARIDGGQLMLMAEADGGLTVDGKPATEANLSGGGSAQIGRYTFTAEAGRDGAEAVLVMEEAARDALAVTKSARGKRDLEQVLPSRRFLGWVASLAILGVFLIWPMMDVMQRPGMAPDAPAAGVVVVDGMARKDVPAPSPMEIAWSSGPLSNAHKMIENDCAACHVRAFEMTTDAACLSCHANIENHADTTVHPAVSMEATRCASCHKEHDGGTGPDHPAASITGCTSCHADIKSVSAESEQENVTNFATQHPIFQLAVITGVEQGEDGRPEAVVTRTRFNPDQPPVEKSGLKFPHAKHLVDGGMKSPNGNVQLQCASCHQLEADGALMRPIEMERDCGSCHRMEFDAAGVKRPLPHADEDEIARVIETYFLAAAMEGGVTTATAPAPVKRKRKKRITLEELAQEQQETLTAVNALSDADRGLTIEWAKKETLVQMDSLFGVRLCGTCHEAQKFPDQTGTERWKVLPAVLQRHWMPKARFNHTPHRAMDCTGCHDTTASNKSEDVLMPDMDSCRDCHVDATETAGINCVSCHEWHVTGRTPMSPDHAKAYQDRADERQRTPKKQASANGASSTQ